MSFLTMLFTEHCAAFRSHACGMRAALVVLAAAIAMMGALPSAHAGEEAARCFPKRADHFLYDEAGWLPTSAAKRIENTLLFLYEQNKLQFVIVITKDLCGKSVAEYASELGDAWGVGSASKDNGVVMVIVPKQPGRKGYVFIAPGRGIQDRLPDIRVKRITREVMVPYFRNGDRVGGIRAGIAAVTQALGYPVPSAAQVAKAAARRKRQAEKERYAWKQSFIWSLVLSIYFGIVLGGAARKASSRLGKAGWLALAPLSGAGTAAGIWKFFTDEYPSLIILGLMAAMAGISFALGIKENKGSDSAVLGSGSSSSGWSSSSSLEDFSAGTSFSSDVEWGGGRFNGGGAGSSW